MRSLLLVLLVILGVAVWFKYFRAQPEQAILTADKPPAAETVSPPRSTPKAPPTRPVRQERPIKDPENRGVFRPKKGENPARTACRNFEHVARGVFGKLYPDNSHFHGEHQEGFEGQLKQEVHDAYDLASANADRFTSKEAAGPVFKQLGNLLVEGVEKRQRHKKELKTLYMHNGITSFYARAKFSDFEERNDKIFAAWDGYRTEKINDARGLIQKAKDLITD